MDLNTYSNPRVRSFFNFDPVEFADDVVCALSTYIYHGIESIKSLLNNVQVSEKDKALFIQRLTSEMQSSLDENADKFELYIMRNIFDISVTVDLTSAIATPRKIGTPSRSIQMNDQEEEEVSEDELNEELKRLYNEIQKAQEKRVQLLTSIKTNKAKLNEAKQLVERLPKINEIVNMANQLPTKNIEDLGRRLQNLLEKAKEVAAKTLDEKKRIEFEKAAFQFD